MDLKINKTSDSVILDLIRKKIHRKNVSKLHISQNRYSLPKSVESVK